MATWIIGGIVIGLMALALFYTIRKRKKGGCVGCPSAGGCPHCTDASHSGHSGM